MDPHPAADRLGRPRRRLDLQPAAGRRDRRSTRPQGRRYGRSIEYTLSAAVLVRRALRQRRPRAGRARRPPARDRRHRATTPATTCRSRSSPTTRRCCGQIAGLGLGGRPAPRPDGAGLADERVPRPLPRRVRPVSRDGRRRLSRSDAAGGLREVERVRAAPRLGRQVAGVRRPTGARRSGTALGDRDPAAARAAGPCRGCCSAGRPATPRARAASGRRRCSRARPRRGPARRSPRRCRARRPAARRRRAWRRGRCRGPPGAGRAGSRRRRRCARRPRAAAAPQSQRWLPKTSPVRHSLCGRTSGGGAARRSGGASARSPSPRARCSRPSTSPSKVNTAGVGGVAVGEPQRHR